MVVLTHQSANIVGCACDRASGIGVVDGMLVISHQPADILVTGDLTGGVDVTDCAEGPTRQPAGLVASAFNRAGGEGI